MGRKRSRKKSGRSSTPQTAENTNERRDPPLPPPPPPDMAASGTPSKIVNIRQEGQTLYYDRAVSVDTLVTGHQYNYHHYHHYHHHHHASHSEQEKGTRAAAADGDEVDKYQEMEIEAKLETDAEPEITGERGGADFTEADPRILQRLQRVFANCHNVKKWKENLKLCLEAASLFEEQGHALLTKVRFDSIHFFVRVKLGSDHDAFLQACTDGTISRGLTKLLITPELEKTAGVKLTVKLDVKESSCAHDEQTFVDSSHANTKTLRDMTSAEVKTWLVEDVKIPSSLASKFEEEGIDGELLAMYDGKDLREDFQLSTGQMRKIMYKRDLFIEGIRHTTTKQRPTSLPPPERGMAELLHDTEVEGVTPEGTEVIGETATETKQNSGRTMESENDVEIKSEGDDCGEREVPLTAKEKESAEEARLRFLLTGHESGTLDSSFHPILVMNKPVFEDSDNCGTEVLEEKLDFVSLVNWNAVFDCYSRSRVDGVCSTVERKREIKLLLPKTFNKDTSPEELAFNDVPAWIFANGRDDLEELQAPSLASDWNEKYGGDVDRAVDFFATVAIPKERAVIVFLILSGDDIQIMSDIFKKFQSSLQGRGSFTFIAENRELYEKWAEEVKRWLPRDQLDKRSIIGKEWARINRFIQKQYGYVSVTPAELPHSKGKTCILPEKARSKWVNIEVIPSNECENTDIDEDSPEFDRFVSDEELAFYQGNAVSWWNFHLTDGKMKRKRYNQVLRRDASKALVKLVKEKLSPPSPNDGTNSIVTITIFHQPGSGASTSARQVLWDFHQQLRCIIVQKAVMPTVDDILNVRNYGYAESDVVPPVMVLLDDLDDAEVIGLIAQLQIATRDNGCLSCIILHCKRTPDPTLMAKKNVVNAVVIEHALSKNERSWFVEKFKEYGEEYDHKPEKLIGFMVMKEECNPDYIQRIVHNILQEVTDKEAQLLKYVASINKFMDDFGMPVSCCDELMNANGRNVPRSRDDNVPWEKLLSSASRLLLIQTRVHTKNGPSLAIKLVNPVLATEVLKQLVEDKGQKIGGVIREFINDSGVLHSQAYTRNYMTGKIRDLLIRRRKSPDETEPHGWFSPFILHLYAEDKDMAFEILKETSEQFKSGFIVQQLARLYNFEGDYEKAEKYANKAVSYQPKNSFFLDTRGRIIIDEMRKYKESDGTLDKFEAAKMVDLLYDGIDVFKRCQESYMLEDSAYSRFAGYSGELKVIFHCLHILEQRVEPFCLSGGIEMLKNYFLTDEQIPGLDDLWVHHRGNLQNLPTRADNALSKLNDFLTFSKETPRTSQDPEDEMRARQLVPKFSEDMLKYFAVDMEKAPPMSVQENPESLSSWRRAQVKSMHADSFYAIFRLAQNGEKEHLKRVQAVLNAIQRKNAFDRLLLVCISFALASCGETDIDYDAVVRQVRRLNDDDGSHYGALFALMLSWPRDDPKASSSTVGMSTIKAIVNLRGKWNNLIHKRQGIRESQSVSDRSLARQQSIPKPSTYFFLAQGKGLNAFVHIGMFHASQSTLEGDRNRLWLRTEVRERLVRLEGILQDREKLVFRLPTKDIIYIRLSTRWHNQPSQQRVSFYLGFNFAEPRAYNVLENDGNTIPVQLREYQEAYPGYLISSIHLLQKMEQDLLAKLDEIDYMSTKRRNRQQLMPEDKELMRSKPRIEEELQIVRAKIQDEIAKSDDDDELFMLVTRKKKKGGGKFLRSTTAF